MCVPSSPPRISALCLRVSVVAIQAKKYSGVQLAGGVSMAGSNRLMIVGPQPGRSHHMPRRNSLVVMPSRLSGSPGGTCRFSASQTARLSDGRNRPQPTHVPGHRSVNHRGRLSLCHLRLRRLMSECPRGPPRRSRPAHVRATAKVAGPVPAGPPPDSRRRTTIRPLVRPRPVVRSVRR